MKVIRFLLQKEFLQIFRNKAMLPIIFVIPIVQLLVLSFAATYELKEAKFALIDRDQSIASRELLSKLQAIGYFTLQSEFTSEEEAYIQLDKGEVAFIVDIPRDFQQSLSSNKSTSIQLVIDAVDGSVANLISSYVNSIVRDFSIEKYTNISLIGSQNVQQSSIKNISTQAINWYNPNLDYITYMVPGILVILVSMIGLFLSGMNIVREREIGTIEQLNVTPITKFQFMIGKLVPFWVIGMFDLLLGLALARFGFQIPFLGSLTTILIIAGIYLVLIQALGLFMITGGAGMKPKRSLKFYYKKYLAKTLKAPFLLLPDSLKDIALNKLRSTSLWKSLGSSEYSQLSGVMRETFVKSVTEYLEGCLPKISHEILLLWGRTDDATPVYQGERIEKGIKNSALVVIEEAGHYAFLDKPKQFTSIAEAFLKG